MKMDIKGLCAQLAHARDEEIVSTKGCNEYLLNRILRPLMNEETVLLKDVDFSQFSQTDIDWLSDYYEALETQGQKLQQFVGAIASLEPTASKARQFC